MRNAEVAQTFDIYNAIYFGGLLERPAIRCQRMDAQAVIYDSEPPRWPNGLLIMSTSAHHKMTWRATLIHEMVHISVGVHVENDFHGPRFAAECNRVGAMLGLEPVEVHDAWNWPAHHLLEEEWHEPNIMEDTCESGPRKTSPLRRRRKTASRSTSRRS